MTTSPLRLQGKAQRPRPQTYGEGGATFQSFCRTPIETSYSPRRHPPSVSLVQCGSGIDHATLRVFTQFGPASEDYRKAVVIHRKPRYPDESLIIKELRREQSSLLELRNSTETLPRPPSARYALPYPTALLTSCGSARDAQSIIRQRKLEATMSLSSQGQALMEGTLSGYSVQHESADAQADGHDADRQSPQQCSGATKPLPQVPLPVIAPSPSSMSYPTSPRRCPGATAIGTSSRSISPRDASPCHPLLPSLFDGGAAPHHNQRVSSSQSTSRRGQRQRPLIVSGLSRASPTTLSPRTISENDRLSQQ